MGSDRGGSRRRGRHRSVTPIRVVGVSALVYAALVAIEPSLAPGLDPAVVMNDDMDMDDMESPAPVVQDPMGTEPSAGP